ncbi:MAG: sigma-70 family RNA polymerase sigma factor [Bacteroidota bacterium]
MSKSLHIEQLVDNLFRREWGKLISVLTKLFGPENLQLAEDVVQETLLKALNTWKINGLPQNPSAWLFTAARNKAIDVLRRQKTHQQYTKSITPLLQSEYTLLPTVNDLINDVHIDDDQLKMMFVCCHPQLSAEAQVAVILKTLCGFSVTEIAKAFVTNYDTIEKRLYRARQSLKENNVSFELPPKTDLDNRLENVLTAIYLLFNEGYSSTHHDDLIRNDLVQEAIRLCELIGRSKLVNTGASHALLSLIHFTAARTEARLDEEGNILLMKDQDRSKWNREMIGKAIFHLEQSAVSENLSRYHIEAGIAFEHAKAVVYKETNWNNILHYYDVLNRIYPSPVVALNRAIVIGELRGPSEAIASIEAISNISLLKKYYLLPLTLGELYSKLDQNGKALAFFKEALLLTQSAAVKKLILQKIDLIDQ